MTKTTRTPEELAEIKTALEHAQATQGAFWDALRELEETLGDDVELDLDNNDLENYDVDDILALVDKDDDENEDDDEERSGQCLCCGTQCNDEGICPVCSRLEWAEEMIRMATADVLPGALRGRAKAAKQKALRTAYRDKETALSARIDSCRKCGRPLLLRDLKDGIACTDQGEGPEAGKVFVYCCPRCRDTH